MIRNATLLFWGEDLLDIAAISLGVLLANLYGVKTGFGVLDRREMMEVVRRWSTHSFPDF